MAEAAAPESAYGAPATVEVMTCVDGWCALRARDATLDGSLPLRVVQGCEPMLDGTAFGLQIVQLVPLRVLRRWGRWRVEALPRSMQVEQWGLRTRDDDAPLRRFEAQRTAAAGTLVARGVLAAGDGDALPLARVEHTRDGPRLRLWTGLLVRVADPLRLLILRASPRRTLGLDHTPTPLAAHRGWVPLTLELRLDATIPEVIIEGEVATLGVVAALNELRSGSLGDAPATGRALLDFYDRGYFDAKRSGEVTRKYRRLPRPPAGDDTPWMRVVHAGPEEVLPRSLVRDGVEVLHLEVRCGLELRVRFDGQRVRLTADEAALAARRDAVEAAWRPLARADDPAHRGALLYLTRYMTPHPHGEPHFFVKPCSLVQTPPGWCTLVEGVAVPHVGDVLRGVVRTDVFHATPTVFALGLRRDAATVPHGVLLARLFPTPRAWLTPAVIEREMPADAPLAPRHGA